MKLPKKLNGSHVLMALSLVVLGYALCNYASNKEMTSEGMGSAKLQPSTYPSTESTLSEAAGAAAPVPASSNDGDCGTVQTVAPSDLLPKGSDIESNTQGISQTNFLQAGHHVGINTVGQSLRNPNLQLRSEPPNPQGTVGPWNNTTITGDTNRRTLEIGSS